MPINGKKSPHEILNGGQYAIGNTQGKLSGGQNIYENMSDVDALETNWNIAAQGYPDDFLSDFLLPGQAQKRENALQMQNQMYQNWWESAPEQMKRAREAGINPNLAAGAIAGADSAPAMGTPSAGSPAAGVAAAGQAIGNIGAAAESLSHANERNALLEANLNNLTADTYLKWKEAGWNDIQSKSMALAMRFMPAEKMLGIMNLAASTKKIHAEYSSFMQGIEESKKRMSQIDAEIELAKAQRDLTKQQELEVEKRTLGIEIENSQKQWRFDKMKELNIDPNNPIEYNMFIGALEGNQDVVDKGANIIYDSQYAASRGQFSAEAEKAFEIAKNREKGINESDKEYKEYNQFFEEHEAEMKAFYNWYYSTPKSFKEGFFRFWEQLFNFKPSMAGSR